MTQTKGETTPLTVRVPPGLRTLLERQARGRGLSVSGLVRVILHQALMRKDFNAARDTLGLAKDGPNRITLYALRHCYGQWLSDSGMPEARIQVGMRHKTADMARRYTKQRDRGQNAQMMDTVLFGDAEGQKAASA
jgi:integrase